jgi:hypothetical protein
VQRPSASTLAAIKVTEPAEDGSSVVLVDSKSRAATSTAVLSVAPAPTSAQTGHPVRAIYPDASGSHRVWFYCVISGVSCGGELVNVKFDDSSSDTLAVCDMQDRSSNSSSRGAWSTLGGGTTVARRAPRMCQNGPRGRDA